MADTLTPNGELTAPSTKPLRELVRQALEGYFAHLNKDMPPRKVYDMVTEQVEVPLLEITMAYTAGNQCQAAEILGLSRNTLRKKLRGYHLIKE
jgi:Fis family transcriptional regulator